MSAIAEALRNVGGDTVGINGYQRRTEWTRQQAFEPKDPKARVIFSGVLNGAVQVLYPLYHRQTEVHFYGSEEGKPNNLRNAFFSVLIDAGMFGAITALASSNPQESLPIAVGGKVIYNAAASAGLRAIDSARARFKPQGTA